MFCPRACLCPQCVVSICPKYLFATTNCVQHVKGFLALRRQYQTKLFIHRFKTTPSPFQICIIQNAIRRNPLHAAFGLLTYLLYGTQIALLHPFQFSREQFLELVQTPFRVQQRILTSLSTRMPTAHFATARLCSTSSSRFAASWLVGSRASRFSSVLLACWGRPSFRYNAARANSTELSPGCICRYTSR